MATPVFRPNKLHHQLKKPKVHYLTGGATPCLMTLKFGVPGKWPEGHKWSASWKEVTCNACWSAR